MTNADFLLLVLSSYKYHRRPHTPLGTNTHHDNNIEVNGDTTCKESFMAGLRDGNAIMGFDTTTKYF